MQIELKIRFGLNRFQNTAVIVGIEFVLDKTGCRCDDFIPGIENCL